MNLAALKSVLNSRPRAALLFVFDDGETVPADFHVTEVGHVVKNFVDCGGIKRTVDTCQLQIWVAPNDPDHRLSAGKLSSILELAKKVIPSDDLPVEVEYEGCVISQYRISAAECRDDVIRFSLADKHTDCLAKEACGLESGGGSGNESTCC